MNNYGGYSWTFPKGGVEDSVRDHPHASYMTAVDEVRDEMGIKDPNVLSHIPLTPENSGGTTGWTGWYLMNGEPTMKPRKNPSIGMAETSKVQWMTIPQAEAGIKQTLDEFGNVGGYQRDMAVLADAVKHYQQWMTTKSTQTPAPSSPALAPSPTARPSKTPSNLSSAS